MRTVPVKADTLADLKDQEGQGLTEYLILVVLISLFCIAAKESTSHFFCKQELRVVDNQSQQ